MNGSCQTGSLSLKALLECEQASESACFPHNGGKGKSKSVAVVELLVQEAAVGIERRLVPVEGRGGRPMAEAPIVGPDARARSRSSCPSSSVDDSSSDAIVEGASVKGLIPSVATPPPHKCTATGSVVVP